MKAVLSLSAVLMLVLSPACNSSDKNSSSIASSGSVFSCSVTKNGELNICTQYQDLNGATLTAIQSECELRSNEGYGWAVAPCAASTLGTCLLPASAQKPAPGRQYFYGTGFNATIAASMCNAQDGTFN